jgi:hypothetical protein
LRIDHFAVAAVLGASVACASKPTPVTVSGDAEDRASLAGKWTGEYNSPTTGRSGSIVFNLSRNGDAASGDVVMVPKGYGKALMPYERGNTSAQGGTQASQVLTIRLVRVAGGNVNGVLDAYRDPQCDCAVETTFNGQLSGDTIEGTFSTRGAQSAAPQTGTWRVKRSR